MAGRGKHFDDLLAGDPAQQVDEVAAGVDQRRRVVGLAPPIGLERARRQVVHVVAFEVRERAERAVADERLHPAVQRHEAHLVDDRDDLCRCRRGRAPDRAQPFERIGQRLLDQHVKAACERGDDVAGVRRVGRADDDGVEVGPEARPRRRRTVADGACDAARCAAPAAWDRRSSSPGNRRRTTSRTRAPGPSRRIR